MNFIYGIIFATLMAVTNSVKITHLKVPAIYMVSNEKTQEPIVLECEYEFENPNEKGFVLKWLLNNNSIYQWIPSGKGVKGFAIGSMKEKIFIFNSAAKKGAIAIAKPQWNMTGEYTCFVQTLESTDKKVAYLQIVVLESDFTLTAKLNKESNTIDIECLVQNVYPRPSLILRLNSETINADALDLNDNDGLYNMTLQKRISRGILSSPNQILCVLSLEGTNYTRKKETIFYDENLTTTLYNNEEEISSAISRFEAESSSGNLVHNFWLLIVLTILIRYFIR